MTDVTYSTNNSGGYWWLSDDDWRALEAAGWEVAWTAKPFLGASATSATLRNTTMREAIESWEAATGQMSNALGCSCCGTPHNFSSDDGEYYSPSYAEYGDRY